MDTAVLEELGLSHAESQVYLSLLELGPSKTGVVISDTGLQSSTVYHVLGSLVDKGLVSSVLKGKIKHFQAEPPESFLLFLDEKKRRLEGILPTLRKLETQRKQKQSATVYMGMQGMKIAMNDILITMKSGEEYYFFQVPSRNFTTQQVQRFYRQYHVRRDAKGIRVKGLTLKDNLKQMRRIHQGLKHSQIRWLKEFNPMGLIIYKNKVMTIDWDTTSAFVIQSESVAHSYRKFFNEKWKKAKT